MKLAALFFLMLTTASPAPQVTHQGFVTVTRIAEPRRQLVMEVQVPARRDSVWVALTTGPGLSTWLWSDCTVDLRKGGGWTAHYPGGKSGGGTVEHVEIGRSLTLHAMAPEQFPTVRRVGTTAVFSFVAVGDTATVVRLTQTGWG